MRVFCFLFQIFGIFWRQKIQTQKWCIAEKFRPQKLGVTKGFFILKVVSDFDFDHFLEKWLQRHLVPVLSGQKFSSGLFQYGSIVSKTCSKSQGKLIDSFFSRSNEEWILLKILISKNSQRCTVDFGKFYAFTPFQNTSYESWPLWWLMLQL